jgi:hypothetical protein
VKKTATPFWGTFIRFKFPKPQRARQCVALQHRVRARRDDL